MQTDIAEGQRMRVLGAFNNAYPERLFQVGRVVRRYDKILGRKTTYKRQMVVLEFDDGGQEDFCVHDVIDEEEYQQGMEE